MLKMIFLKKKMQYCLTFFNGSASGGQTVRSINCWGCHVVQAYVSLPKCIIFITKAKNITILY